MDRSCFRLSRRSLMKAAIGGATAASFAIPHLADRRALAQDAATPVAGVRPRARDLGVPFDGQPGPLNAITDVAGVTVGHVTLIEGEGPLVVGSDPVRTGVTTVLPSAAQNQVLGA